MVSQRPRPKKVDSRRGCAGRIASTANVNDAPLHTNPVLIVDPRKFFAELQRRNVYRAGVIYTMSSWLLIQVATQVFPFFAIPNWVIRSIIVVLVIGFPVALAL